MGGCAAAHAAWKGEIVNNRDRDSVAKLLEQVAQRLADAPEHTRTNAESYAETVGVAEAPSARIAHQAGALQQVCIGEAATIRSYIKSYLTSPPPRRRGKR
jgi:hypothetical protein